MIQSKEENQSLKLEIKDLKSNLKINKEIIENFFKNTSKDNNNNITYIEKLKQEIDNLNLQIENIIKEKDESRNKVNKNY